ncbi:MAG: sensor histidine kinase [Porphyromonas sp.]|nr:sensor histidine kinase [Porphyromonas sp.]
MKRVFVPILLLFLLLPYPLSGQSRYADSLLCVLKSANLSDRERANLYADITESFSGNDMYNTYKYATKGLEVAQRCNDKELIFRFYNYIGSTYTYRCSYDTAKIYLDLQLDAAMASGNSKLIRKGYQAVGNFYARQGLFIPAVEGYLNVLKHFDGDESCRDYIIAHGNIGECYRRLGNYKQALGYLEKERVLGERYGNMSGIGQAYRELGYVYLALGDTDKALESMLKVKQGNACASPVSEADVNEALVKVYLQRKEYDKALECVNECLNAATCLGDPYIYTLSWNSYANIFREQGLYSECYKAALNAWNIDSVSPNTAPVTAFNIAFSSAMMGQKEEAAYFFGKYEQMTRECSEKNYQEALSQMEALYQTEKKQQQIITLERERTLYIVLGISGLLLLLLLLGLLFYRHLLSRQKRIVAEQQVKQLQQERQLVASLALLDGENAERSRLSRDLHDGLGSLISVIKLHLHSIESISSMTSVDAERFSKVLQMLDEFMEELRRVAHNMMPESLSRDGIKTALEDFCLSIPMVNFQFFGENPRLDHRLEVLVYRCAYELINNAIKHANATHINVQLTVDKRLVSLTVQDNGKGFDPNTVTYGAGFTNMRNRISAYNGKINLYSSENHGTEVTIEIELTP